MNQDFCLFQTRIFQATQAVKTQFKLDKNPSSSNSIFQTRYFKILVQIDTAKGTHRFLNQEDTVGSHRDRGEILDLKSDGAKSQFHIPIEQLDRLCSIFEVTRLFSDFLKKFIFCLFSKKIHILLNESIFEPFWSLNRPTFPP